MVCCRASKAPFTFIMQIMFGNPSLSLTFSWAAPEHFMPITQELAAQDLAARSGSGTSVGGVPLSTPSGSLGEDYDLLNKPFELTLARSACTMHPQYLVQLLIRMQPLVLSYPPKIYPIYLQIHCHCIASC